MSKGNRSTTRSKKNAKCVVVGQTTVGAKQIASFFRCTEETDEYITETEIGSPIQKEWEAYDADVCLLSRGPNSPANETWGATVYVDPQRYGDALALKSLHSFYEQKLEGREFRIVELKLSDLEHWTPFCTKIAEVDFRQRGYLSDVEKIDYKRGAGGGLFLIVQRAESAADHQLAKLAALSSETERSFDQISKEWADVLSRLVGSETIITQQDDSEQIDKKIEVKFSKFVPLVESEEYYRPCTNLTKSQTIHVAYRSAIKSALANGLADRFQLSWATKDDLRTQIHFEMRHAERLFCGASREALFLWQTQVLAILRKAAWECDFDRGVDIRQAEADIQYARSKMLADIKSNGRSALNGKDSAFNNAADAAFEEIVHQLKGLGSKVAPFGEVYKNSKFVHGLKTEEILISATHGSPYRPVFDPEDNFDRQNPTFPLCELATWMGELKRHKFMSLDGDTAYKILRLSGLADDDFEDPNYTSWRPFERFFKARLREPVWTILKCAAAEVIDRQKPISVRYQWTRSLTESWSVKREQDCFLVTGPLLDFPIDDARAWNAKAEKSVIPPIHFE